MTYHEHDNIISYEVIEALVSFIQFISTETVYHISCLIRRDIQKDLFLNFVKIMDYIGGNLKSIHTQNTVQKSGWLSYPCL